MIDDLIRRHLRDFRPYRSARSESLTGNILLDANELSSGSAVQLEGIELNRYPDPYQQRLRAELGKYTGVADNMVFVGVGSDEIIDLLLRLLCEPGADSVAILEPTYGVYGVSASLNNVPAITVPLDEKFQIDRRRTLDALTAGTKIIFCCSPNNPTGNLLRQVDIEYLCQSFPGLVVADEAYVEFAGSASLTSHISSLKNLVVLRTLSKAWGLAGLRCGYCIADPKVIFQLLRIKAPYNMNAVTAKLALDALGNRRFLSEAVSAVARERERLRKELALIASVIKIYPSDANFLLVEVKNPTAVFEQLLRAGIVVRRRTESRLQNCLRITIGTHDETTTLLNILRGIA